MTKTYNVTIWRDVTHYGDLLATADHSAGPVYGPTLAPANQTNPTAGKE
jgi:hypothetical protein